MKYKIREFFSKIIPFAVFILLANCVSPVQVSEVPPTYTPDLQLTETILSSTIAAPIKITNTAAPIEIDTGDQDIQLLVEFIYEYVFENEIYPMIEIIEEGISGLVSPPAAFIIIWSPATLNTNKEPWQWLGDIPYRVWLFEDGIVTEPKNMNVAITEYVRQYIENAPSMPSIFTYSHNEFGILSLFNDGSEARVYLEVSCGTLCGHGIILIMEIIEGEWVITDIELQWVS